MNKQNKPAGKKYGPIMMGVFVGLAFFYCGLYVCKGFFEIFTSNLTQSKGGIFSPITFCMDKSPMLVLLLFIIAASIGACVPILMLRKKNMRDDRGFTISGDATHGSSRFMDEDLKRLAFDLRAYGKPDGFILGVDKDTNELITVPWNHPHPEHAPTNRNIALFGPPGTRKTSGVLLPNIYSCICEGHSIAVTDPKGEIYRESIAAAKMQGYNVRILNLLPGQFIHSDGWDALKVLRLSESPQDMAEMMAALLIQNTGDAGDDFWGQANTNLLKLALLYVAKSKAYEYKPLVPKNSSGNTRTIQAVYRLICSNEFAKLIKEAIDDSGAEGGDPYDKQLLEMPFNMWINHSQKDSIQAGLGMRLGFLQNETVARVLSEDDIDFRELSDKPTIIYVICSDQEKTYKSVLTLFSSFLFKETVAYADSKPTGALDRPLYIFFEEMNNIGKIPDLDVRVATLRGRNIGMIFCYQDVGQIMSTYSGNHEGKYEWNTILGGCAIKLCLGGGEQMTREYFSKESGQMTILTQSEAKQLPVYSPIKIATEARVTEREEKRPVLLPDEIKKLEISQILIFPFNKDPLLENKYFYKHHPMYKVRMRDKKTGKPYPYSHHMHKPRWITVDEAEDFRQKTGLTKEDTEAYDDRFAPHYFPNYYKEDNKQEVAKKNGFIAWLLNLLFKPEEDDEVEQEPIPERKTAATFDTFRESVPAETSIPVENSSEDTASVLVNAESAPEFIEDMLAESEDGDFDEVLDEAEEASPSDTFFVDPDDPFAVFGSDARD